MTDPEIVVSSPTDDPNQVTLFVGGKGFTGWTDIAITLRAEGLPNSFDIAVTSRDPKTGATTAAMAGDTCEVEIGNDRVITGYVDRNITGGSAFDHMLRLVGRGKCQDLVDCSAEWPTGLINTATAFDIAKKLASAYGIEVLLADGAPFGPLVPQLNLNYGETAYSIIERITRAAGLLAYEDAQGRLVLAQVGKVKAASGFAYGQNVERWEALNGQDMRMSDIVCTQSSVNIMSDLGDAGFTFGKQSDPNVKRHRLLYVPLDGSVTQGETAQEFCERRAKWELARRAGRSRQVRLTCDSWRDSAGKLWTPNTLVPVDVPGIDVADKLLVIAEVTFQRNNDTGTTADLVLMPKEAFALEPIALLPVNLNGITPGGQ